MTDQERCTRCGGQVFPAARFCPRCGTALAAEEHTTDSEAPPPGGSELNAWEWNNKGVALSRLGRYQEAIQCYDEALEIDPRHVNAWANKGAALSRLGRHAEALQCYDKALEIDPRNVNAWGNKGLNLNSVGRYQEAIVCYDKALEIDPGFVTGMGWQRSESLPLRPLPRGDRVLQRGPRDRSVERPCTERQKNGPCETTLRTARKNLSVRRTKQFRTFQMDHRRGHIKTLSFFSPWRVDFVCKSIDQSIITYLPERECAFKTGEQMVISTCLACPFIQHNRSTGKRRHKHQVRGHRHDLQARYDELTLNANWKRCTSTFISVTDNRSS